MTCTDCRRNHPTAQPSIEFDDAVLCDLCHQHRLAAKAEARGRDVAAAIRAMHREAEVRRGT